MGKRVIGRTPARRAAAAAFIVAACVVVAGGATASGHPSAKPSAAKAPRSGRFAGIVHPVHVANGGVQPAGDPAGGTPPLIFHGGPMMGTRSDGDKVVLTPIFWAGTGYSFTSAYRNLIVQFLKDAAADSEKSSNVFSTLFEYTGSNGGINYKFSVGAAVKDSTNFPAAGCTTNTGPGIYADASGYTTCIDDAQVISEAESVIAAKGLPRDNGHMYLMFLPKHVETCFYAGNPSGQACTINFTPSAAFCAYHSQDGSGMVYANMPFPIYQSATGYSCTDEGLGGPVSTIQSPNGNLDADVEVSPLSHEIAEAVTDPDTTTGWFDSSGYENGDECAYTYGTLSGSNGGYFNQVINSHHYLAQEEFSNADFASTGGGCLQGYIPATKPSITKMSSHSGSHLGGATITITGKHLAGTTSVKFGTTAATFTLLDDGRMKVTTPAHAAGTVDVRITNAAGTSVVVAADQYTYS